MVPVSKLKERRAQSLYCAISLAQGCNAFGLGKRRNKAIAPCN
jgi:hypothetical protein